MVETDLSVCSSHVVTMSPMNSYGILIKKKKKYLHCYL